MHLSLKAAGSQILMQGQSKLYCELVTTIQYNIDCTCTCIHVVCEVAYTLHVYVIQ